MGGALHSSLTSQFDIDSDADTEDCDCATSSFSPNHGKNLQISRNALVARRLPGNFCNAIVFTEQPITPYGITVRINKVASQWSGYMRLGFTSKDPARLNPKSLPKSLIPDLCAKKGYWGKSLDYENLSSGDVVHVWVDSRGLAKYTVNSHLAGHEACRVFLENLPTNECLWTVFDVYGNCTEIELLPNSGVGISLEPSSMVNGIEEDSNPTTRRSTAAALIANNLLIQLGSNVLLPDDLFDTFFHTTCGSKISFSDCWTVAVRDPESYHNGIVFVNSPLLCNRTYLFTIVEKTERCLGNLRIGVTDVNPSSLADESGPWPADCLDFVSSREGEFWKVGQICEQCNVGDVVAVFVTRTSKLSNQRVVMYNIIRPNALDVPVNGWTKLCDVEPSAGQIWMLIDLFGKTNSIALIGMTTQLRPEVEGCCSAATTPESESSSGGEDFHHLHQPQSSNKDTCSTPADHQCSRGEEAEDVSNTECAVCMQYNSDTVIYDCGHCCLCYSCAHDLLRLKHHCPICRRPIKDVIKVFYG